MPEVYFNKAKQVVNSLVVKLNGGVNEDTNQFTFNGNTSKSINITPSSIGASPSNHTHTWSSIQSKPQLLQQSDILTSMSSVTDNNKVLGAKTVKDTIDNITHTNYNVLLDSLLKNYGYDGAISVSRYGNIGKFYFDFGFQSRKNLLDMEILCNLPNEFIPAYSNTEYINIYNVDKYFSYFLRINADGTVTLQSVSDVETIEFWLVGNCIYYIA